MNTAIDWLINHVNIRITTTLMMTVILVLTVVLTTAIIILGQRKNK